MTVEHETSILGIFRRDSRILAPGERLLIFERKRVDSYRVTRHLVGQSEPGAKVIDDEVLRVKDESGKVCVQTTTNEQSIKPPKEFTHGFFRRHKVRVY